MAKPCDPPASVSTKSIESAVPSKALTHSRPTLLGLPEELLALIVEEAVSCSTVPLERRSHYGLATMVSENCPRWDRGSWRTDLLSYMKVHSILVQPCLLQLWKVRTILLAVSFPPVIEASHRMVCTLLFRTSLSGLSNPMEWEFHRRPYS